METQEAIELLEQRKNLTCHDCIHPAMVGWCENHCKLPKAFDMAIDALKAPADPDTVSRQLMHDLGATCIARRDKDGDLVPIVGIDLLPPAPEPTEQQATCEYCHEDAEGYVRPVEKNNHAFVRFGMNGWELSLKGNGWHGETPIHFCPMCGRKLQQEA